MVPRRPPSPESDMTLAPDPSSTSSEDETVVVPADRDPTLALPEATRERANHPSLQPRLAEGVELIGEYEGSGFKEPPSLVRRTDGQVIQLPPLLYSLLANADGRRSYEEIAAAVGDEIKRGIDADQVRFLVEEKLRPLGVLALEDGSEPDVVKPDPFLGLKFRMGVVPERASDAVGTLFKPLFFGPAVIAVLVSFVTADVWLFLHHGVAQALRQSIEHPGLFLALFFAVVLAAAFHEIGHAAACRYGGGHPGKMGCGLYLAWPAFYTDVTDAYRLGRRARLRTDLGGVYFNVVIVLATVGAYLLTGFEPLLLLVIIQHLEIVHQLLPVVRLDGYYIVSDLTGVPDLFARIGPILRSAVPWRQSDEQVKVLKPWVRAAVTAWVLIVVPLLVFELLVVLLHLPRLLATGWDSGVKLWHATGHGFTTGDYLGGVSSAIQIVVLAIPIIGILLMLYKTTVGLARWLWRTTSGRPVLRTLGSGVALAGVAALALAWIPKDNYTPIQPGERGTFAEGVGAVRRIPTGRAPLYIEEVATRRAAVQEAPQVPAPTTSTTSPTSSSTTTSTSAPDGTTTTVRQRSNSDDASTTTTTTAETQPSTTTTTTPRTTTTQATTTTTAP
jgi:putative peptide zinc metalloprotease protein